MQTEIDSKLARWSLRHGLRSAARVSLGAFSLLLFTTGLAQAGEEIYCPFCSAASQTLRQESLSMDAVAIGSLVTDGRLDIDGNATFLVERVIRGESLLKKGQKIEASYFGPGKSTKKFLLLGVDPKNLVWSSPLPLSEDAEKYIDAVQALPDDQVERLAFFQKYFEHPDSLLARDSYDEFALAPYEDVKKLQPKMNREQLMEWIRDPQISPDRKRLYYTMLGICGTTEDAVEFESMIRSTDPDKRAGLDALIASYLMLRGEEGLSLINEQFLTNRKASYPDVYSSVMALRFHGTESDRLPKEAILKSMRHLIDAPDLADLVIPDLARWGDWSQIDRLSDLFKNSNDENSWVRVPVVNYLRACPLPEAKERLVELEKIDPKAVKRASTFFPIPSPAAQPAKKGDKPTSSMILPADRLLRQNQLVTESVPVPRLTSQAYHGSTWQEEQAIGLTLSDIDASMRASQTPAMVGSTGQVAEHRSVVVLNSNRMDPDSEIANRVFAVNSLTLLSVVASGGVAFAALMGMIAGGSMSGRCAILCWLLLPRR
jgi:hypothetical protein